MAGMTQDLEAMMIQILPQQTRVMILAHVVLLDTILIEVFKTTQVSGISVIQVSKMKQISEDIAIQISKMNQVSEITVIQISETNMTQEDRRLMTRGLHT